MGAAAKKVNIMALLTKEEVTNNTPVSLSNTTDGQELQYSSRYQGAPGSIDYASDGDLGPSVSEYGQTARVGPTGRSFKADFPMRLRPAGIAYSSSVVSNMHRIFKAAGFTATVDTTSGAEKWTFTPSPADSAFTSLTGEMYTRKEKWSVAGMIGSLKYDAPDTKPPIWTFSAMGIASLPVDASVPVVTYPLQTIPPQPASSILLTLGNLTTNAEVLAHSFDLQREMTPRVNQSANGGLRGFEPGDWKPTIKVTLEATALVADPFTSSTAFDPYRLVESAPIIAVSLQHGTTQYFRDTLNFSQCQVIDAKPGNKDSIATVELTIAAIRNNFSIVLD